MCTVGRARRDATAKQTIGNLVPTTTERTLPHSQSFRDAACAATATHARAAIVLRGALRRSARRKPSTPALPVSVAAAFITRLQRCRVPFSNKPLSPKQGMHLAWDSAVWCVCPVKSQEPRFAQGYAAGLRATLLGWQACCPLRCAALCQSCYELPRHHVLSQTCAEGGKATETITKNTNTKILHYKRQPWSSHTAL